MASILAYMDEVPALIQTLCSAYLPFVVVFAVLYLIGIFIPMRFARIIRNICIAVIVAGGVIGVYERMYALTCLAALLLIVLIAVSLIVYAVMTTYRNHKNEKIERRALAAAEQRRNANAKAVAAAENKKAAEDLPMSREEVAKTISQLEELKDKGLLTEEEFNQKKQQLYEKLG